MKAHFRGGALLRALTRHSILCLLALVSLHGAGDAGAQVHATVTGPPGQLPQLPTGPATIRGTVVHPTSPEAMSDLEISLYALSPSGAPGLASTRTDASGGFSFSGVSNEPGVIYLLGTSYLDVPFGMRVTLGPGALEEVVEVPLAELTTSKAGLELTESEYRLDWVGARLLVRVQHRIRNRGVEVALRKPGADDGGPLFVARLPEGARDWSDRQSGFASALVRDGDRIGYYGPAYPGDQEVGFQYFLDPTSREADAHLGFTLDFPDAPGEVIVLSPHGGPTPTSAQLRNVEGLTELEGTLYRRLQSERLEAGGRLAVSIPLPETSQDVEALEISKAGFWIDQDDAAMRVTVEMEIEVDANTWLNAAPGQTLLDLPMPADAELTDVSVQSRALGIVPVAGDGLAMLGPVPPGKSEIRYKFRVPVQGDRAQLDFAISRPVALLNVLVADNGVEITGKRLHRRRPFKQGSRIYLHREAYQLAAGEPVSITLDALDRSETPPTVIATLGLLATALAAAFLAYPLRGRSTERDAISDTQTILSQERAGVYESIRDIDHDFETGKIDAEEHALMREELKGEALALLRREREQASEPSPAATQAGRSADPGAQPVTGSGETTAASAGAATPGAFCRNCGGAVAPHWQFCSHCGATIEASGESV